MSESQFWQVAGEVMVPLVVLAAWIDWRRHRVPNWLSLIIAALGLSVQTYFYGGTGLLTSGAGWAAGLGLLIVPWAMHLMGAGDVKLLAGIGAWLGPKLVLWAFVTGAMIGGLMGVVMILIAGRIKPALENASFLTFKLSSRETAFSDLGSVKQMGSHAQLLPYGVPLTLGTLVVTALKIGGWW